MTTQRATSPLSAAVSDVGLVRGDNQDRFLADDVRRLYAVADGMGGHAAGDVAAEMAIDALRNALIAPSLNGVFKHAHETIVRRGQEDLSKRKMGTTLTVCTIADGPQPVVRITHAGDSAAYLVSTYKAKLLTKAHSNRHVLLNCLGSNPGAFIGADFTEVSADPGDIVVLASDGLTYYLDHPSRLVGILNVSKGLEDYAKRLVRLALDGGGHDNVTVVAVMV